MRRAAVCLIALAAAAGCRKAAPPAQDIGPPAVTVSAPLFKPVTQFTDLTGNLAPVKTADVRPQVSGYVQKVDFKDGAEVKAGDRLVLIDPRPFEADLKKAEGSLKTAEAQLKLAEANESRASNLRRTNAVSKEEYDQAVAQKDVAAASVFSARAGVETAKLNLDYTSVKAPFDGRVDRIYVTEGNVVTGGTGQGTILTTVVTTDPIYAYFDLDEQTVLYYLGQIKAGKFKSAREAKVPCEVQLKGEKGYPHKGYLDFVGNRLNPATASPQIRGLLENPGPPFQMSGGMFVRGRIPMAGATDPVMLLPDEAVVTDQAQKTVYVVGPDGKVRARPVTLGAQAEGLRIVLGGITKDDRVVIRGVQRVVPDAPVDAHPGEIKPVNAE